MLRRTLAAAALAAAAFATAPAAEAAPPYCVAVSGNIADACAITPGCVVEGNVLPATIVGFAYCVVWP